MPRRFSSVSLPRQFKSLFQTMSNESRSQTTIVQTVSCDEMLPMESVRGAQEIFKATAEAEQRHILVKTLFERGVGVPSVENYRRKQSSACL